jgi:hypothetical protein
VSKASVGRIVVEARRAPPVEGVCKLQRFVACSHGILSHKLSFFIQQKSTRGARTDTTRERERWRIPFKLKNILDEKMLFLFGAKMLGFAPPGVLDEHGEHYVATESGETTGNWRKQMP